jgi:hypothetical protein
MEAVSNLFIFLQAHADQVFALLFFASELLAYIPAFEGNGVFQSIHKFLESRVKKNV